MKDNRPISLTEILLEGNLDGVIVFNRRGTISDLNSKYAARFKLSKQEMLGRCIWDLFPGEVAERRKKMVEQVFSTQEPFHAIDEREGIWNDFTIYPLFDDSGCVHKVAVLARDITRLKKLFSELNFTRSAFKNSICPLAITDSREIIFGVNPAFVTLWGYADEEEILGRSAPEFWLHPFITAKVIEQIKTCGSWSGNLTGIKKNGTLFSVLASASSITDEDGIYQGIVSSFTDMTQLERLRLEKDEIEHEFEYFLEILQEGIWRIDREENTTYLNSRMTEILGSNRREIICHPPDKFMAKDDKERFRAIFKNIRQGEKCEFDFTFYKDNTQKVNTLARLFPLYNRNGQFDGALASFIDITTRRNKEKALEKSEKKYRELVSSMHEVILTYDSEYKITYINNAVSNFLGYHPQEILGKSILLFLFEKDRSDTQKRLRKRQKGLPETYEQRFKTMEGHEAWGLVSVTPMFDETENFRGAFALITDISRRKQAEDSLKTIYEQAGEGFMFHDRQGNILAANPYMCELIGYTESELKTMHPLNLVREWEKRDVANEFDSLDKNNEFFTEHELLRKDKKTIVSEIYAKKLRENLIVGLHRDITDRKRTEQQKKDLERIMRHDLKGILNNLKALPALIKNEAPLTRKQNNLLDIIDKSGRNMIGIIDNHMSVFQIERNQYHLKKTDLNVTELIKEILVNYSSIIKTKDLQVVHKVNGELAADEKIKICADGSLCHVMLNNLICNAIEAAPEPRGRVDIHTYQDNKAVSIRIENDGAIPEEIRTRFGEKYVTGKRMGTGVGVYSARLIAMVHGGTFSWDSTREKTRIELTLPRR